MGKYGGSTIDRTGLAGRIADLWEEVFTYTDPDTGETKSRFNPQTGKDTIDALADAIMLFVGERINVETLSTGKTLVPRVDNQYQWLNPNGTSRTVTLSTTGAEPGDVFVIKNTDTFSSSAQLIIWHGVSNPEYCYAGTIKTYRFDGEKWYAGSNGTGDDSMYRYNTMYGTRANGINYGCAGGFRADGSINGSAWGFQADGHYYGAALGRRSRGPWYQVAIGNEALGRISVNSRLYNLAVGYRAGFNITTGKHNLIFGHEINAPDATFQGYMSLGNALVFRSSDGTFHTGTDGTPGRLGIGGITDPQAALSVPGGVQIGDDTDPASYEKRGTMKYVEEANASVTYQCKRVGPLQTDYAWVEIDRRTW